MNEGSVGAHGRPRRGRAARGGLVVATLAAFALAAGPVTDAGAQGGTRAAKPAGRPVVCLVLSGGGARGAAHIGVLKVLEELRVPVDCIAGTSMGSLVGGAYASGMSIAEMEALIATITSDELFHDDPPRQDQAIRRKLDDRSILFELELGVRDGELLLPKGAVSGIQLETVLRRLAKASAPGGFDALPIPFRAVATDLVSGKAVVIDSGELAHAMRASMSVPAAIAPAQVRGMLLVDGGLTDNLPVDVARAMGADVVIAVNLGTPLLKREQLGSVVGITEQFINILTEQNVRASLASLKPTDVLIEPELGNFSAADFDHLPKAVPIGEAAARKAAPRLSALSLAPAAYAELRAKQGPAEPPAPAPVAEIRFDGLKRVNPAALEEIIDTAPGRPLDKAVLDRDLRRIYGTGDFERLDYRILREGDRQVVMIDATEKEWGPNYLRFGLGLVSDFAEGNAFNLAVSYRRTWLDSLGAEWRVYAQVGETAGLATEYYQPLPIGHGLFVAPRAAAWRNTLNLYQQSDRIATYNVRQAAVGVDLGVDITRYGEVRLGVETGTLRAALNTGPPSLAPPEGRIGTGGLRLRAIVDQLDNVNFPRSGYAALVDVKSQLKGLGADFSYVKWEADAAIAFASGRHSLTLSAKAGGAGGGDPLPAYDQFFWGGFLQQSGYPTASLAGAELAFGRAIYLYRLTEVKIIGPVYAGASLELGRMGKPLVPGNSTDLLTSSALFLGADTPIGPFYLGFGFAADGNRSAYMFLGRP